MVHNAVLREINKYINKRTKSHVLMKIKDTTNQNLTKQKKDVKLLKFIFFI